MNLVLLHYACIQCDCLHVTGNIIVLLKAMLLFSAYKGARRAPFWKKGPEGPLIFTAFHEKCNFCTYFFHWCSKWSPYTGWLAKSAISAPTLSVVLQMVHLYRLTDKRAIFGKKLSLVLHLVPLYWLIGKSAIFGKKLSLVLQFLHLPCYWCSKWSLYVVSLGKSRGVARKFSGGG